MEKWGTAPKGSASVLFEKCVEEREMICPKCMEGEMLLRSRPPIPLPTVYAKKGAAKLECPKCGYRCDPKDMSEPTNPT